mmetsp:Transcript_761/g.1307  ORF Transcript_761/g.1307 Transcript_761/m.1307 type:complete len:84 (+) Transcript_761:207-458(+)
MSSSRRQDKTLKPMVMQSRTEPCLKDERTTIPNLTILIIRTKFHQEIISWIKLMRPSNEVFAEVIVTWPIGFETGHTSYWDNN